MHLQKYKMGQEEKSPIRQDREKKKISRKHRGKIGKSASFGLGFLRCMSNPTYTQRPAVGRESAKLEVGRRAFQPSRKMVSFTLSRFSIYYSVQQYNPFPRG